MRTYVEYDTDKRAYSTQHSISYFVKTDSSGAVVGYTLVEHD